MHAPDPDDDTFDPDAEAEPTPLDLDDLPAVAHTIALRRARIHRDQKDRRLTDFILGVLKGIEDALHDVIAAATGEHDEDVLKVTIHALYTHADTELARLEPAPAANPRRVRKTTQ